MILSSSPWRGLRLLCCTSISYCKTRPIHLLGIVMLSLNTVYQGFRGYMVDRTICRAVIWSMKSFVCQSRSLPPLDRLSDSYRVLRYIALASSRVTARRQLCRMRRRHFGCIISSEDVHMFWLHVEVCCRMNPKSCLPAVRVCQSSLSVWLASIYLTCARTIG